MAPRDFHAVAQVLPAVVWETDPRGDCTFMSGRWTELTGQAVEAALGAGWRQRLHADELPLLTGAFRDASTHRVPVDLELRLVDASQALRWVRLVASPDVRGNVVVGFVGLIVDVTPARQAAVELAERASHLRLLEARNRALLESLPDLLLQLDAEGRFVDYQAAPAAALMLAPTEFLGRRVAEVLPGPVAAQTQDALERARETGEHQRYEYALEIDARGPRDFEARVSPMRSGGFLALVRDITELKRTERQLIAAREQAVHASSSKTQFLAAVSHEIRTPLSGIIGVTQLLRTLALPDEVRDYVGVLESSGEALLELVNEVLDLAKIEADRLELEVAPFELAGLVRQASRGFLTEAAKKRLELSVEVEAEAEGVVLGDAGRTRQIVNNLVGNAIKFTDEGRVTVSLSRAADGALVLAVADTGPGIAPERSETIFEPFAPSRGQRRQGTGLGLSIARRLALLMGGDLSVRSVVGQGSTFRARLPLAAGVVKEAPPRRARPVRSLSVLVAEDNEVNAKLTRAMLEWLGHRVETVGDGRAALAAIGARAFDLVFMDVQMPHLDGLEATRQLRQNEAGTSRHLPVIALTANAMKADELACLSAGMDAYLAKPVTVEALSDVLAWFGEAGVTGTRS